MKIVKDTNNNIISGTEVAYQKDTPTEQEQKKHFRKNGKHIKKSISQNTQSKRWYTKTDQH